MNAYTLDDGLVDAIYEAAVLPELWPRLLDRLSVIADGDAASFIAFGTDGDVRCVTTKSYEAPLAQFVANAAHLPNIRPIRALERAPMAFVFDLEVCTQQELDVDPVYETVARPYGFGWTAGTVMPVPSGDLMVFDLARFSERGPFERAAMERLDQLRPHLARAALLSSRLRLQAARQVTDALETIGLPAAVVGRNRVVLAANRSLIGLAPRVRIGAFDRIYLHAEDVDRLFSEALSAAAAAPVRSIPLAAGDEAPALIAHVVPIRRAAGDIFAKAEVLVIFTIVALPSAPLTEVLTGLFDLTPAEAKVARSIALGHSIEDISQLHGVARETIRTQLKAAMAKTATSRQAELAVLLSGARPLVRDKGV